MMGLVKAFRRGTSQKQNDTKHAGSGAGGGNGGKPRVVVVGDRGVGKTTLIHAVACSDGGGGGTEAELPHILTTIVLSADLFQEAGGGGVDMLVVDSGSLPCDEAGMNESIRRADVIIICYEVPVAEQEVAARRKGAFDGLMRLRGLERVKAVWFPLVRKLAPNIPVTLVGTKCDLRLRKDLPGQSMDSSGSGDGGGRGREKSQYEEEVAQPLLHEFPEIESCIECSARRMQLVNEVFYYAFKAWRFPSKPLLDTKRHGLTRSATRALSHIFYCFDKDRDGVLSDVELNDFQVACFNAPLETEELQDIKQCVEGRIPSGVKGGGITIPGFLMLQGMFLERGRTDITWSVLRLFGYDDDLNLRDDAVTVPARSGPDQVYMLSEDATRFLDEKFDFFDADEDGALSHSELDELFFTAPSVPWEERPWSGAVETVGTSGGGVTRNGFMAQWSLMTMKSPRTCIEYLYYLGFYGLLSEVASHPAVTLSLRRREERKRDSMQRRTLQCWVMGSTGSGKSALMDGLVGRPFSGGKQSLRRRNGQSLGPLYLSQWAATILEYENHPRTLCMREIPEKEAKDIIQTPEELAGCDLVLFVFDGSSVQSFEVMKNLLEELEKQDAAVPCLITATKDDLGMSEEVVTMSGRFCAIHDIALPINVSMRSGDTSSIYLSAVMVAMHPDLAIPESREMKAKRTLRRSLWYGTIFALTSGTAIFAAHLAIKYTYYAASRGSGTNANAIEAETTESDSSSSQA